MFSLVPDKTVSCVLLGPSEASMGDRVRGPCSGQTLVVLDINPTTQLPSGIESWRTNVVVGVEVV